MGRPSVQSTGSALELQKHLRLQGLLIARGKRTVQALPSVVRALASVMAQHAVSGIIDPSMLLLERDSPMLALRQPGAAEVAAYHVQLQVPRPCPHCWARPCPTALPPPVPPFLGHLLPQHRFPVFPQYTGISTMS